MAYQVLARKYRPQRFADVKGQEHVTRTLLNALAQNRIAHGYIFSGHRGIGKTTIARILAMALNCRTEIGSEQRPTPEPCEACESCTEIRAGNAVDVIEIDAATNRGIDEIRELRDAARYRPARDRYKIYILDEAHQITDAAFNALLKTLEEPPDHVIFMMATTQPEDIPQTIRSRCQHFSFHAVRFDDILDQLREIAAKEDVIADDAALALLAEAGDGSMRDALSIMDQAIASAPMEAGPTGDDKPHGGRPHLVAALIFELMGTVPNAVFERLLESISENNSAAVIEEINRLLNAGNSASQLARQLVRYLRNCLMARLGGESTELLQVSPDERARAGRTALLFSEEDLTRYLDVMLRTFDQLNYRQEQRFHLELGLLKLVHLQRLLPMEQFLSQLPAGPKPGAPGPLGAASARAAVPAGVSGIAAEGGQSSRSAVALRAPAPASAGSPSPGPTGPAFSPFEADRNRKSPMEGRGRVEDKGRDEMRGSSAPSARGYSQAQYEGPVTRELSPIEAVARASEQPAIDTSTRIPLLGDVRASAPSAGVDTALERSSGSVAIAELPDEPSTSSESISGPELTTAGALEAVREAVCAALDEKGHNTAAALLSAGGWSETPEAIRVEVNVKRTMLSLMMNAEAEKICKAAALAASSGTGVPVRKFIVESADGEKAGTARNGNSAPVRTPATGSTQAEALAHPLVRHAQELFSAEVRHVHDLRKH